MFTRYRAAYGAFAAILPEELGKVHLQLDSLPNWAVIKVNVQPDYTIKIGAYNRFNSVTHYYRVRGPRIETSFALVIPKVLYDTQAGDTMEYGRTSVMMRSYYVDAISGHRFPVNLGAETFGVNSPIDVGVGRGGFAVSIFLDVIELIRQFGVHFDMKVNAGLDLMSFFPINKEARDIVECTGGVFNLSSFRACIHYLLSGASYRRSRETGHILIETDYSKSIDQSHNQRG